MRRRKGCLCSLSLGCCSLMGTGPSWLHVAALPPLAGCHQLLPCMVRGKGAEAAEEGLLHGCVLSLVLPLPSPSIWANSSPMLTPALPHNCLPVHLNSKRNMEKRGSCHVSAEHPALQRPHLHMDPVVPLQKDSSGEKLDQ